MGDDFFKKTQDTLGKIIKKPPLTEKLLRKPPFRFLHDIFTEVIRTTGFLNGIFNENEMDAKNVTVKEDKMAFLQKVIDAVSLVMGDRLSARPSKIVAGHEPEKTNELLQAIARCIRKNMPSDDAVKQVISGDKPSKVQEKPPTGSSKRREGKENREQNDDSRRKRRDKDGERERERSSDRRRRSAGKEREKEQSRDQGAGEGSEEQEGSRHRGSEKSRDRSERSKEDKSRERREERKEKKDSKTKIRPSQAPSPRKSREPKMSPLAKSKQRSPVKDKRSPASRDRKPSEQKINSDGQRKRRKSQPRREERDNEEEQEDRDDPRGKSKEETRDGDGDGMDAGVNQEDDGASPSTGHSRPPRPASAKGHRRRPAGGNREPVPDVQAKESGRSKPARPPSARPAAPRVRQRPDAAEEEIARMESAGRHRTAPIIVDRGSRPDGHGSSSEDDEDDQFLVQDEAIQPPELDKLSPILNGDVNGEDGEEEEHGGLVRKILETKKELEKSAAKGSNLTGKRRVEIERAPVNEVQRRKERELVMRDIEKLRTSVQKLCRSAVPLGKIIDYIQEDMDSMQNELIQWKKENKEHAAVLREEESVTTKTIEPLQVELDELDRSILSQLDMIAASKCNVLRNQEKIDKMVAGVTART